MFYWIGIIWIVSSIISVGIWLADEKWNSPTQFDYRDSLARSIIPSMFGPVSLLVMLSVTSFARHGISFTSKKIPLLLFIFISSSLFAVPPTGTMTWTPKLTKTPVYSNTATATESPTYSSTQTPTPSTSLTVTPSASLTVTDTHSTSATETLTTTPTHSATPTYSTSTTPSATPTQTATATAPIAPVATHTPIIKPFMAPNPASVGSIVVFYPINSLNHWKVYSIDGVIIKDFTGSTWTPSSPGIYFVEINHLRVIKIGVIDHVRSSI